MQSERAVTCEHATAPADYAGAACVPTVGRTYCRRTPSARRRCSGPAGCRRPRPACRGSRHARARGERAVVQAQPVQVAVEVADHGVVALHRRRRERCGARAQAAATARRRWPCPGPHGAGRVGHDHARRCRRPGRPAPPLSRCPQRAAARAVDRHGLLLEAGGVQRGAVEHGLAVDVGHAVEFGAAFGLGDDLVPQHAAVGQSTARRPCRRRCRRTRCPGRAVGASLPRTVSAGRSRVQNQRRSPVAASNAVTRPSLERTNTRPCPITGAAMTSLRRPCAFHFSAPVAASSAITSPSRRRPRPGRRPRRDRRTGAASDCRRLRPTSMHRAGLQVERAHAALDRRGIDAAIGDGRAPGARRVGPRPCRHWPTTAWSTVAVGVMSTSSAGLGGPCLVVLAAEPALDGGAAGQREHAQRARSAQRAERCGSFDRHQMLVLRHGPGVPPTSDELQFDAGDAAARRRRAGERLRVVVARLVALPECEAAHRRAPRAPRRRRGLSPSSFRASSRLAGIDQQARQAQCDHRARSPGRSHATRCSVAIACVALAGVDLRLGQLQRSRASA